MPAKEVKASEAETPAQEAEAVTTEQPNDTPETPQEPELSANEILAMISGLGKAVERIAERVEDLTDTVEDSDKLSLLDEYDEEHLSVDEMVQRRRNVDRRPTNFTKHYQDGQHVRLNPESAKGKAVRDYLIRRGAMGKDDEMPIGRILSFMRMTTNGPKYKVKFPGTGQDGCIEDELVSVDMPKRRRRKPLFPPGNTTEGD